MAKQKKPSAVAAGWPPGLLTVREAMNLAQCNQVTIRRLIRRRKLGALRWKHLVMVKEAGLRRWLRARRYRPLKPAPVWATNARQAAVSKAAAYRPEVQP